MIAERRVFTFLFALCEFGGCASGACGRGDVQVGGLLSRPTLSSGRGEIEESSRPPSGRFAVYIDADRLQRRGDLGAGEIAADVNVNLSALGETGRATVTRDFMRERANRVAQLTPRRRSPAQVSAASERVLFLPATRGCI